jgi:hypothetical protein
MSDWGDSDAEPASEEDCALSDQEAGGAGGAGGPPWKARCVGRGRAGARLG